MSCNNCQNTNSNCGCTPRACTPVHCECPIKLDSGCITVKNATFSCSNIEDELTLTETLEALDAYICDKFNLTVSFFTLLNVGAGSQIYKGIDGTGRKLIRSLVDSNLINIVQGTDDIVISVDETALNTFIEANQKTTTLLSVGSGATLIKGTTDVGDNTQYDIKEIISSDESVTVTPTTNEVDLTVCMNSPNDSVKVELINGCWGISLPSDENIKQFYVNESYTGTSNGSILKPFKKLVDALVETIGSSPEVSAPEFPYAQIILQTSVTVSQSDLTANTILQNKISVNTTTIKSDSSQKRTITLQGTTDYPIDTEFLITEVGVDGNLNLLAPVFLALDNIELLCTATKGIVRHQSYSDGTVNTYDSNFSAINCNIFSQYRPSGQYVNAVDSNADNIELFGSPVFVQDSVVNNTPHVYFYGVGANGQGGAYLENVSLKGTNQSLVKLQETSLNIVGECLVAYDNYYLNTEDKTVTDGIYTQKTDVNYFDIVDSYCIIDDLNERGVYATNPVDSTAPLTNIVGGNNTIFKLRTSASPTYKTLIVQKGFIFGMGVNYLLDTDNDFITSFSDSDFGALSCTQEALLLTESPQPVSTKTIGFENSYLRYVTEADVSNNISLYASFSNINLSPFSSTTPIYPSNNLAKAGGLIPGNFYINSVGTPSGGSPGFLTVVV